MGGKKGKKRGIPLHAKAGVQSEGWEEPDSLLARSTCPLGRTGSQGPSRVGSRVPCSVPRGWIPAAGSLARKVLPRGQAIPACVLLCPGNCRPQPACPEPAASQRQQVHGRVEPKVCAGPSPLADELGPSVAKNSKLVAKPFFQSVLVPAEPGALPLPAGGCRDAAPSRGSLPEEGMLSLCRAPIPLKLLSLWG